MAYDRAAICSRGVVEAKLNFALENYADEIPYLTGASLVEVAASLR
jgi:hypothetical protein